MIQDLRFKSLTSVKANYFLNTKAFYQLEEIKRILALNDYMKNWKTDVFEFKNMDWI